MNRLFGTGIGLNSPKGGLKAAQTCPSNQDPAEKVGIARSTAADGSWHPAIPLPRYVSLSGSRSGLLKGGSRQWTANAVWREYAFIWRQAPSTLTSKHWCPKMGMKTSDERAWILRGLRLGNVIRSESKGKTISPNQWKAGRKSFEQFERSN